jgi:hypothetical protein
MSFARVIEVVHRLQRLRQIASPPGGSVSARRHAHHVRRFLDRQSAEEPELDDPRLIRIES